ncbi:uncharacterized protein UTRI_05944_B [Ustilago trichophora]|uniref:Uncharacterized protein n=1 Tax=Ustilago trichophora TaxID=86804 RepID=A0A5C3END7_9BASI|nr:uncharacterized protein UTRI_05944_B [Ustilago trichophora]
MSRKLVSYSDISEPPPPSSLPAASLSPDGGVGSSTITSNSGKRKRHAEQFGKGKKGKGKRGRVGAGGNGGQGIVLHWDDPSFSAEGGWDGGKSGRNEEDVDGYRSYSVHLDEVDKGRNGYSVDGEQNEEEEESEIEEMFYDAIDALDACDATTTTTTTQSIARQIQDNPVGYTQWKYDENAEPYDRSHRHASHFQANGEEEQRSSDLELDRTGDVGEVYDEEDYYDEDEGEEEEEDGEMLPFAIPDVVEFHRLWDARRTTHSTSSTSDSTTIPSLENLSPSTKPRVAAYRPPPEVGGGGRILDHAEIWGDLGLVEAYSAALDQYVSMHSSCTPTSATNRTGQDDQVKSALWYDAPRHDSLLAEQVKADTMQILALQRHRNPNHPPQASPLGEDDTGTASSSTPNVEQDMGQGKRKTKGKPILTIVPHAHLKGNSAWKNALKVVQSTPNSIGINSNRSITHGTMHPTDPCQNENENEKEKEMGDQDEKMKMYNWWYAGYYTGYNTALSGESNMYQQL